MCVIRTEKLGKTYKGGTVALCALDLEVQAGEVFGFLGPNGAGKSTTIQLLLNFIRPTSGRALLFGRPVTSIDVRQRIGYLPETVSLHGYYTGQRLLQFYARLHRVPDADRSKRVAEVLDRVSLREASGRRISQYSKGMLQRLGLANALIGDPDLLILDEPTTYLDPVGRRDFRDIVLDLKARGKTVFVCSHVLSEVESVCDRVAILQRGVLRRSGTLEELSQAGGSRIVVRSLPARVIEALSGTDAHLMLQGSAATIACRDEQVRREVEELLASEDVTVERVEREKQTLEDIFLDSIQRGEEA